MTLRTRLFLLVSAVVAAMVALTTWAVSSSARRSFEALDAQRTSALIAQFRLEFVHQSDEVARRVERVAESDEIRRTAIGAGASDGDRAGFVDEAAPLATTFGLDLLDLVAADGTIVSSAHWPARFGYRHPLAGEAVAPSTAPFLAAVDMPRGTTLAVVAVRTTTVAGRRLSVVGGRRLESAFLQTLTLPVGMRALLYRRSGADPADDQLIDAGGRSIGAAPFAPLIARVRDSKLEHVETVEWPDGPETVEAIPLAGRDGHVLGVLLVASSGRELAALIWRIRWTAAALGALGLVLGFVVSYAVAARVTRPVERLADAARSISAGQAAAPLDVAAPVEIADLAAAFDSMTKQLDDQRERLMQAERVAAWRELARRLAHELKNPLFPLRVSVDNLRRAQSLPAADFKEVFDESLAALSSGLNRLNAVVGQFTDFARMPAPRFADTSIDEVVRDTLVLARAELDASSRPPVRVSTSLDSAVSTIKADADQLKRALHNLLLNAIDAMPDGGELAIRSVRNHSTVRLSVSDSGVGLTDEECRRLFTPYYTTKQHGTGLGLAIVQSVVSDHAGKIWVDSRRHGGTTIHLELPIDGPPSVEQPARPGNGGPITTKGSDDPHPHR